MFVLIGELFAEIWHEIAADPGKFGIEVVQFALLVVIVWAVALGIGKRKGMLVNMLEERRARIASGIERAEHTDVVLAEARSRAGEIASAAKKEATAIVRDARRAAKAEVAQVRAAADAEAEEIRRHAQQVLDAELEDMHVEIRDRLVDVVANATRSILNEGLTLAEQRDLIQDAVTAGIDRVEVAVAAGGPGGGGR